MIPKLKLGLDGVLRLAVLLALIVLDFGIKQVANRFGEVRKAGEPTLRTPHGVFNHGILPNRSAEEEFGPHKAPYHSNSLGLRDARVRDVPATSDRFRVLFLGNSFTEGGGFSWDETFVGLIQRGLEEQGVEVFNGAVASYSPLLCRLKAEDILIRQKTRMDLVVMCLDVGTVRDVYFFEETPEGGSRFVPYGPFQEQSAEWTRADALCQWLEKHLEKNFVVLGAISRNTRLFYLSRTRETGLGQMDTIPTWAYDWPEYQGPHQPLVDEGLARSRRQMDDFAAFLRGQRVGLAVLVYPWPQQIRAGKEDSRMVRFWEDWCAHQDVFFISVFPDFLSRGNPTQILHQYYLPGDRHWTPAGHRVVADALLDPGRGLPLWVIKTRQRWQAALPALKNSS